MIKKIINLFKRKKYLVIYECIECENFYSNMSFLNEHCKLKHKDGAAMEYCVHPVEI